MSVEVFVSDGRGDAASVDVLVGLVNTVSVRFGARVGDAVTADVGVRIGVEVNRLPPPAPTPPSCTRVWV